MVGAQATVSRTIIMSAAYNKYSSAICTGAVLGIFIWVGQSKANKSLGRPTEVVYVGIMGMTRAA